MLLQNSVGAQTEKNKKEGDKKMKKVKNLAFVFLALLVLVSAMALPAAAQEDSGTDPSILPKATAVWEAPREQSYDMWPSYAKISYRTNWFDDCWGATTYFIDDHEAYLGKKCSGKSYCKVWGENGDTTYASTEKKNSANDLYAATPKVQGQWYARQLDHSYVNNNVITSGTDKWRWDITVNTYR